VLVSFFAILKPAIYPRTPVTTFSQSLAARRPRRPTVARFTLIELLVVVAIISILASMLLPALARARYSAKNSSCQSQMKQMGMGLILYASDNDSFLPLRGVNRADFTPNFPSNDRRGGCIAGRQIWGLGDGSLTAAPYGPNKAMGMGIPVVMNYYPLDMLYCPSVQEGTWFRRKVHFGAAWASGFTDIDGNPWTSGGWVSGSNYYMDSDYAYRSGDWTTVSQERRSRGFARDNHAEFPDHVLLMDGNATNHLQLWGANLMWGDLSISWWRDQTIALYTISGPPSYPTTTTFHSFFLTRLMDEADQTRR